MKHSIRQKALDPITGLMVTKIETVNGELGTGIKDKNGVEIFEGDRVVIDQDQRGTVKFANGRFLVDLDDVEALFDVSFLLTSYIEIVGHVDD